MNISQIDQSTQGDHTINQVKIADFIWHDLVKNCAAGICRLQIDVGTVFWKIVKNFFRNVCNIRGCQIDDCVFQGGFYFANCKCQVAEIMCNQTNIGRGQYFRILKCPSLEAYRLLFRFKVRGHFLVFWWAHTLALKLNVRFVPQRQFCLLKINIV